MVLGEGALERRLLVAGQALDRRDGGAVGLHREHRAALHRDTVEVHRAGTAAAGVAADVRAGEIEVVAQQVDEQSPRGHVSLEGHAVHRDGDDLARGRCGHAHPFARSDACRTARTADVSARLRR